jgi:lipid A 3-O-deacylase
MSRPSSVLITALGLLSACLIASSHASAQSLPPLGAAPNQAKPDPVSIWTLQDENASVSTADLTDRYYVNGFRLGWTSGTGTVPAFLDRVNHTLWGEGQGRFGFDLSQQIYTPLATQTRNPPRGDRPYAGVLLGTLSLLTDTANTRSVAAVSLGVIGPAALGEEAQNGFHDLISQGHNLGWGTQLHNEPAVQLSSQRTWRLHTGSIAGLETDMLPDLTAGLGNVRIYAQPGLTLRIGQGLDSDFGVARLRPGLTGSDAFTPNRPVVWYVFAGVDGQAKAHDITLDGNTFESSRSVKLRPLVAEAQAGVAVIAFGARLTLTEVFQTQEFQHQKGGLHQFTSIALSMRF